MKITVVIGSPRPQGHGAAIARALLESLGGRGAKAKLYELGRLSYSGCRACLKCKTTSEVCVAQDDLTAVLEDIRRSDLVVVSAPVFMGEISAQAKGLFDRFYSYLAPDFRTRPGATRLPAGKTLVFILTQGNPDEHSYADVMARHRRMLGMCGFADIHPIHACGLGAAAEGRAGEKTMARAGEIAQAILRGGTLSGPGQ